MKKKKIFEKKNWNVEFSKKIAETKFSKCFVNDEIINKNWTTSIL